MRALLTISAFCFLLSAFPADAAKQPAPEPVKFRFSPRATLYVIRAPDLQLWSQHEIAMTKWPKVNGWDCKQARVRGVNGDRTNRNFLVVRLRDGKLIAPNPKWFVRPDPFTRITPPMPAKTLAAPKSSPVMGPPAPRVLTMRWNDCPGQPPAPAGTTFRVYRLGPPRTLHAETTNSFLRIQCDGAPATLHAFVVTAVFDGMESTPGVKGCP